MSFDVKSMTANLMLGFQKLAKEKGQVSVDDVAKKICGGQDVSQLTSIFAKAAIQDGNANLSEAEFQQAISTEEFLAIVKANTQKSTEQFLAAKDPSEIGNCSNEVYGEASPAGTPRDRVVAEEGEYFANEVWDPMKKLAGEALKYMQEHNGTTEGFTFTGFPQGVKLIQVGPMTGYNDKANDTVSIKDGQPQTIRNADVVQAFVLFDFNGKTYRLFSDESTNELEPWGNPSYIEEDRFNPTTSSASGASGAPYNPPEENQVNTSMAKRKPVETENE